MATKKLVNVVDECASDSLAGLVAANDALRIIPQHRIVVRHDYATIGSRVAVLSGGGSGHEPFCAGHVGPGMLTAAVCGKVFTSPSSVSILAAIRLLGDNRPAGVLAIVANYTGDRLNFGRAIEAAKQSGINVDSVVVADDCALVSGDKSAGRRGLCGIVLAMKIAGALSEAGKSLPYIVEVVTRALGNLGTIGLCLSPCSVPGSGPNFVVAPDEMELGLGVHGEAGVKRLKLLTAKETVAAMFAHMTDEKSASALRLQPGDRVVTMLNNLGATSCLEAHLISGEVIAWLSARQVPVERAFCGPQMTSLEMAGFSITILKVDDELLQLIDAETEAPAWPRSYRLRSQNPLTRLRDTQLEVPGLDGDLLVRVKDRHLEIQEGGAQFFKDAIRNICTRIIDSKDELNHLDSEAGDSDCGSTLSSGAQEILSSLEAGELDLKVPQTAMLSIARIASRMGGTSGGIYGLLLTSAASAFESGVLHCNWLDAIGRGIAAVQKYGGAEPGDRTMLDPLHTYYRALTNSLSSEKSPGREILGSALETAAQRAEETAQQTANMAARAGRASYVSKDRLGNVDPGARAVALIARSIADTFRSLSSW